MSDEAPVRAKGPNLPKRTASPDRTAGKLITETFDYDGGREVTAYIPPYPPEFIVFAGDGQRISSWGDGLTGEGVPSTMIVGVHGLSEATPRLHEYSPAFYSERFARHEEFFVATVRRWVALRFAVALPPERTAVFGVSAGGELALALGVRHPAVYGVVFSGSPGGGYKPSAELSKPLPRVYLVAGTKEPFFLQNAIRWASALRSAGADVVLRERNASHGDPLWRSEFPLMVAWAFGSRSSRSVKSFVRPTP
jgi:pimeloyl-ACP methyl ester carboxylesterase